MAQVIYGNQFQGGLVRIPPSKSAAHRQVLCAALSRGKCTLSHVDMSEDIQATVAAVEALGAKVSFDEAAATLTLDAANLGRQNAAIDCRESGSTLRFLIPHCRGLGGLRPGSWAAAACRSAPWASTGSCCPPHGVEFRSQGGLPLELSGKLKSGVYRYARQRQLPVCHRAAVRLAPAGGRQRDCPHLPPGVQGLRGAHPSPS